MIALWWWLQPQQAATSSGASTGALITAGAAILVAVITSGIAFLHNRQSNSDTRTIRLIETSQGSLEAALAQANADIVILRRELTEARTELEQAEDHVRQCEQQRVALDYKLQLAEVKARTTRRRSSDGSG